MKCMKYKDFYNIARYGNTAWKGVYTAQEITQNAREYYSDFLTSKNSGGPTFLIRRLMSLLAEDGSEKAKMWLYQIATELNMIHLSYHFCESNNDWLEQFVEK